MNKFVAYIVITLLVMTASCSRVPKFVLSEKKMRSVLYDMQLAEAFVETNYESYRTYDERNALYKSVFAKHNISQADYDTSLIWYGKNLDLYMQIYKLVLRDINASIANLGDIKPNPLSGDVSAKDSIDVWIYNRNFTFSPDRLKNVLVFDIEPKVPYSSGSSYVLGVNVWGLGAGKNLKCYPRISVNAVQQDTIVTVNQDITSDGYYEILMKTAATKQVKRVYGYLMLNSSEKSYHRIYLDDIRLMKYNYGSKALRIDNEADTIPPV